jgi:hypothetical protein
MVVQMGADGTEDNVSIKICSDSNDLCCENKMTKVKNEDWRATKKQEWLPADFGECKEVKFKVKVKGLNQKKENIHELINNSRLQMVSTFRPSRMARIPLQYPVWSFT